MNMKDIFKECFEEELELWDYKNIKDFAHTLYNLEYNYNNCDITSRQTCFNEHEIIEFLEEIKNENTYNKR